MNENFISQPLALTTLILTGLVFAYLSLKQLKSKISLNNYLVSDRSEGTLSLTLSLTASALGAWILFSPASAATWGGIGTVIGYALGAACPLVLIYFFGPRLRKEMPNGVTLTQFIKKKFGDSFFKFSLKLIIFYLVIFLCAEVTAIALLLNFLAGLPLWLTSIITLTICLSYVLKGGLKLSILTDKYQFVVFILIFLICYLVAGLNNLNSFSLEFIGNQSPQLLSINYLPNYFGAITFFVAVAATNLFHQGNWQRVYAAKNVNILKRSLIYSAVIIFPIVFLMGFSGLVSVSIDNTTNPDLSFFKLFISSENKVLSILVIVFALSLTLSTIDTLINAVSSLIVVDGKTILKQKSDKLLKISKYVILLISFVVFIVSSKGLSILYLFLLADLLCCCAVVPIFSAFFRKKINYKISLTSLIISLLIGLSLFPSLDFSKSILTHFILNPDIFSEIILNNLLFFSFITSLLSAIITNNVIPYVFRLNK
jgi:Na+/proline symporter